MASDLVNHNNIMKPSYNPGGQLLDPFPESFHAGGTRMLPCAISRVPGSTRTEAPLFGSLPWVFLHLAVDSYPLINW